jgi:hypothetical protein
MPKLMSLFKAKFTWQHLANYILLLDWQYPKKKLAIASIYKNNPLFLLANDCFHFSGNSIFDKNSLWLIFTNPDQAKKN